MRFVLAVCLFHLIEFLVITHIFYSNCVFDKLFVIFITSGMLLVTSACTAKCSVCMHV